MKKLNSRCSVVSSFLLFLLFFASVVTIVSAVPIWNIKIVDPDATFFTSTSTNSNGYPAVSYSGKAGLKYASWNGSTWNIQIVDKDGGGGSLALDSKGNPHISYSVPTDFKVVDMWGMIRNGTTLKYAYWTGSEWSIQTVDPAKDNGWYNSISLDHNGNPHISYSHFNDTLKYAYWNGLEWKIQIVDPGTCYYPSIAMDPKGNPRISYFGGFFNLRYASLNGTVWSIQTVDPIKDVGYGTSLALDSQGNPNISYWDGSNEDLKYAQFNNSAWTIQTVDSKGAVGLYSSIVVDSSGKPSISYWDKSNGDLKYAAWTGSNWSLQRVDSNGTTGLDTSIALDSDGNPQIGYRDWTDGSLKYASVNPEPTETLIQESPPPFSSSLTFAVIVGAAITIIVIASVGIIIYQFKHVKTVNTLKSK
jgi:hypothetical protein